MNITEIVGPPDGNDGSGLECGDILLDRFKLIKILGKGGMAEVWEAEDNFLNINVALKIFSKGGLVAEKIQRIKREVIQGRSLSHKNLLKYYDVFETDKYLLISMELIKGKTVEELIKEKEFKEEEIKNFLKEIIEALDYIHKNGIIHRDIKPSNIFLKEDGSFVLGDLGIIYLEEEEPLTRTKEVIGTLLYIPPDAFEKKFTPSYDYYSLGVTLYEMVSKHVPFKGTDAEIIKGHHFKEPPKIKKNISKSLRKTINGMLIKKPEKRWGYKEIKKYIEGRTLPFLPKEKRNFLYFFNILFLIILSIFLMEELKEKEITDVKIQGEEVIGLHKNKILWKEKYKEPVDYSFFDIDMDGKRDVFVERIEDTNNFSDFLEVDFINSKGQKIYKKIANVNHSQTNDFPLFSSFYYLKIENRLNFLPKNILPIMIRHHSFYPYYLILFDLKENKNIFYFINSGQANSFFKWKNGIGIFSEENPLLRQKILFLVDYFHKENYRLMLSDFNCFFYSSVISEVHIFPPRTRIINNSEFYLESGEVVKLREDGTLSNQREGAKGISKKLLSSYYDSKALIFKGLYNEAKKIIDENIKIAKEENLMGALAIFKNLKAILFFYEGDIKNSIKETEKNFEEFPYLQYFKIQKGMFYLLKEKYENTLYEWSYFTQGTEDSVYRFEFLGFSSIVEKYIKNKKYNLENLSVYEDVMWDKYFIFSKGIEKILDGNFNEAEKILKPAVKVRDYYVFALAYFMNKYLKGDFDLKEFENYIKRDGIKISCFFWLKELIFKNEEEAKILWEKFKVQTPFVIDYAIYYSLIIEVAKRYPEKFPKEYYKKW
jgi:serine/threonine-protein kinase